MISEIEVKGLFGRFSYKVTLDESVMVLTGPNGAGKSTLLSLIEAVSRGESEFIERTPFSLLSVKCDGGEAVVEKTKGQTRYSFNGEMLNKEEVASKVGKVKLISRNNLFSAVLFSEDELKNYIRKIRAIPTAIKDEVGVSDDKLELFTRLLDERTDFKKPIVNKEDGLYFYDENTGERLDFSQLSAGEIALCSFYYDLLFCTPDGALILIDEPETSLHIVWQFTLISDLYDVLSLLGGARALVSTHSPQVISHYRDLQIDLGEQYEG